MKSITKKPTIQLYTYLTFSDIVLDIFRGRFSVLALVSTTFFSASTHSTI